MPVSPFLTFSSSFDDDDGSLFQFERGFPPFLAFLFYLFLSFSLPSVFAFGKMQLSTFVIDRLVVSRAPPAYLVKQEKEREKRQLPPAALALVSLKKMSQALEVLRHYDETANAHEAYSSLITFPVSSFKFCRRRATTATKKFVSVSFRRLI